MNQMRSLFGGGSTKLPGFLGNIVEFIRKLTLFARNPLGALLGLGVDIPQNIGSNPEAMVNYLRNSGQMSTEQYDQFSELANQVQSILPKKF